MHEYDMERAEIDNLAAAEVVELAEQASNDELSRSTLGSSALGSSALRDDSAPAQSSDGVELLELMLENQPAASGAAAGVTLGRLVAVSPPKVVFAERPRGVIARTVVPLPRAEVGREVMLHFVHGNLDKPIVAGILIDSHPIELEVDGKPTVVAGDKRIVLKCGKASITLTRAGKVIIKGAYVSTHSTGVNRIKGGSVQIN